jgi:hypothetical protein
VSNRAGVRLVMVVGLQFLLAEDNRAYRPRLAA